MHEEPLVRWTVDAAPHAGPALDPALRGPFPAAVPGCVHLDLIAAGRIDDLTVTGDDRDQLWVSETPWRYRTTLRRPAGPFGHATLVLDGVDTVGRVSVGGELRLAVQNMFRTYELDVTADLAGLGPDGEVEVVVELDPVLPVARAREAADPLPRPGEYWRPFNQVRKTACSFGWDWGPTTMTAGLWRPALLRTWTGARFADVRVRALVEDDGTKARVVVDVAVEGTGATGVEVLVHPLDADAPGADAARGADAPAPVVAAAAPVAAVADGRAQLTLDVPGARRWWPHTEGDRPRYGVTVTLLGATAEVLDRRQCSVGFRTVRVVQEPDAAGIGFALHVNGRRVWVRGLNWIPDDLFPSRVSAARYRERLGEAVAAGANAVRVWGGGRYEDDAFYDACDDLGLLVIQDFLFACAAYPEDDDTVAEVRAEVRDNVRRLRHRASLALWCGNNENLWGHEDWDWKAALAGRPWGARYYTEILPELLAELDPDRPYVPGSPFSPDGAHPNDPSRGLTHIWDVWNERDYLDYPTWRPRFVSEFGYQAPASWPTLVAAVGSAPDPADPRFALHQRAADGDRKLLAGLTRHLPSPPGTGPAWYVATQLLQARAVTTGVRHLRSLHDHCSGAVWWQLNDCWPAVSWSVVDVAGRRKLAWHALRDAFDPRLVTFTAASPGASPGASEGTSDGAQPLCVVLVNDTDAPWRERLVVRFATATGSADDVIAAVDRDVEVPAHGHLTLEVPPPGPASAPVVLAVADVGTRRATHWSVGDLDLVLPGQQVRVAVEPAGTDGLHRVTVTADALLRDLVLPAELFDADARVDGQLTTLLPGESTVLQVRLPSGGAAPTTSEWLDLIWSDNRLRTDTPP